MAENGLRVCGDYNLTLIGAKVITLNVFDLSIGVYFFVLCFYIRSINREKRINRITRFEGVLNNELTMTTTSS